MNYRFLGKTGLKVAEVGIGTWQIAKGDMWANTDEKESYRALEHYVNLGGNFIDTAWIYSYSRLGNRHGSHELIGKFLKESKKRNSLIIVSKVPPKNMHWPAKPGIPVSEVFPNEWIEKCVDDSLKSLHTEYIDLMQFHVWQDDFVKSEGWKTTIQKIIKSGKVRYWGISINDYQPENCLKTLDTGLIDTIQFIFNIFHQKPSEKLVPYAQKHKIGLIARVPLDEGGLSGKFTVDTRFARGDFRNHFFQPSRLPELVKRTDALKIFLKKNETLAKFALRFILSFNAVSTVIPGMRKVSYVDSNTSVSDAGRLSPKILTELKKHSWERNFYI
jgi:aryl-alcohol dehydrogenase-like predicted oxidoreductase